MHKITLLAVGKIKTRWFKEGCEEYQYRLKRAVDLHVEEVLAGRSKEPEKQRQEEGEQILHALERFKGDIILLDETGEGMTSGKFAEFLGKSRDRGNPLVFVLGGAYGFSQDVRDAAKKSIKLSDMTLPHELCRLFFLEQLYRATEIMKGSGYHH
jgi:23S rRNA (pseudouridine1915-N3)-methyltransferase